jgi:hypothetical protein
MVVMVRLALTHSHLSGEVSNIKIHDQNWSHMTVMLRRLKLTKFPFYYLTNAAIIVLIKRRPLKLLEGIPHLKLR